jgi:hypothetical protein
LLNHFGRSTSFTLLDVDAPSELAETLLAVAKDLGLAMVHITLAAETAGAKYPCRLTLIRPDLFVCWQGNSYNGAAAILNRVRGETV